MEPQPGVILFIYNPGICNEDFTFSRNQYGIGIFEKSDKCFFVFNALRFIYHANTFIPGRKYPSINMIQKNMDPNNDSEIQRFSPLDIPNKYQYMTGNTLFTPMGRFFNTIV